MDVSWTKRYLGIRFLLHGRDRRGIDCYGLVKLIYSEVFCKQLPEYIDYPKDNVSKETAAQVATALDEERWRKLEYPKPGCLILLRMFGHPLHIGLVLSSGEMIHAQEGVGVVIENFRRVTIIKRVIGFYEYVGDAV